MMFFIVLVIFYMDHLAAVSLGLKGDCDELSDIKISNRSIFELRSNDAISVDANIPIMIHLFEHYQDLTNVRSVNDWITGTYQNATLLNTLVNQAGVNLSAIKFKV